MKKLQKYGGYRDVHNYGWNSNYVTLHSPFNIQLKVGRYNSGALQYDRPIPNFDRNKSYPNWKDLVDDLPF